MPGDCSPSRSVVSKISTLSIGVPLVVLVLGGFRANKNPPGPEAREGAASTSWYSPLRKEEALAAQHVRHRKRNHPTTEPGGQRISGPRMRDCACEQARPSWCRRRRGRRTG